MRRVLVIAALALATAVVLVLEPFSDEAPRSRVDVMFDTAKGLVAGQSVKVAGTPVGNVENVRLVRVGPDGYKARLELSVDSRFMPFRADARCKILPQGLISENYVDCDPGTPSRRPLAPAQTGVPTVPLAQTSIPASLQDMLDTFSMPTSDRVRVVINQLGLGTAGRGEDFNAILRRANPAIVEGGRVLATVASQRRRLSAAVAQTDRVLAELAGRDSDVRTFVDNAAAVTETTAARRGALGETVRRLPPLLSALDQSLGPVRRITEAGTPLLVSLRSAAPEVERFTTTFNRFEQPSRPALGALARAASAGRRAVVPARPVAAALVAVSSVGSFAHRLDSLMTSLRDSGSLDGVPKFFHGFTTGVSGYDKVGHLIQFFVAVAPECILAAAEPGPRVPTGCSHAFDAPGYGRVPAGLLPSQYGKSKSATADSRAVSRLLDYLLK